MEVPDLSPRISKGIAIVCTTLAIGVGGAAVGEHLAAIDDRAQAADIETEPVFKQSAQELIRVADGRDEIALRMGVCSIFALMCGGISFRITNMNPQREREIEKTDPQSELATIVSQRMEPHNMN